MRRSSRSTVRVESEEELVEEGEEEWRGETHDGRSVTCNVETELDAS